MKIKLYETYCQKCPGKWYELDDDTLDNCPHCGQSAAGAATDDGKKTVVVVADPKTGTIRTEVM